MKEREGTHEPILENSGKMREIRWKKTPTNGDQMKESASKNDWAASGWKNDEKMRERINRYLKIMERVGSTLEKHQRMVIK